MHILYWQVNYRRCCISLMPRGETLSDWVGVMPYCGREATVCTCIAPPQIRSLPRLVLALVLGSIHDGCAGAPHHTIV